MKNFDSKGHVRGRSLFVDDIPVRKGTLHGVVLASTIAHGKVLNIDFLEALALPGVIRIFTEHDIPGENQIGGILPDESLFAAPDVHFIGHPIALIVAKTERIARKARSLIRVEYEEFQAVTDPREAKEKGLLLFPPRTFQMGNVDAAFSNSAYVFEGRADSGAQEHLYIETQGTYSIPKENGSMLVHSSTQGPTAIQRCIARILDLPMHKIEVDVQRLGGAFGGKEDQANAWAALSTMAAFLLQKPVKLILSRHDDMYMTGKRHPYSSDFRIALSNDLKIVAWEVTYFQNGGAAADLSPAILERTLFHSTNSYYIPNVTARAYSCKTNLPPFTAFRGFGAPQAMFVMESAIALAAGKLGISAQKIQEKNLINEEQEFPYGQIAIQANAISCWTDTFKTYNIGEKEKEIERFNQSNSMFRKGLAIMPICFGISFTNTSMNQARALVHIYQDGSVGISTGAVEMGQGVNTKMKQIAARAFSIDPSRIKLETTNTTRVANTSPTAASSGADLNGKALLSACNKLLSRLKECASAMENTSPDSISLQSECVYSENKKTNIGWEELVKTAFLNRVSLSQVGHYATPEIHFDKSIEKGHPFAYHVFGTACVTVKLDCLRGSYRVESVQIVHDFGSNQFTELDLGQIEGAVMQGIGWMTMEEIGFNEKGQLLSNSLSTYKVPDLYSAPQIVECNALKTNGPELAILRSKAVGEPPFMYGIGAYFALQNAIRSFNPEASLEFNAPFTPEKVLMTLYPEIV